MTPDRVGCGVSPLLAALLTEAELKALLDEPKRLPPNFRQRLQTREKSGHCQKQRDLVVNGERGNQFRLFIRESMVDPLAFCVGLTYQVPNSNVEIRLRRYDGKYHTHSNKLERSPGFFDFHIHIATERYQAAGLDEDGYAEPTVRYADVTSALNCLLADCGFVLPDTTENQQGTLF